MALQTPGMTTSYDQSATYILSLDQMVDAILLDDSDVLSTLGFSNEGKPVTQTKHEWDEDELNPVTVTAGRILESAASATGSALVLTSTAHAARLTAGTLLKDQLSGKFEVLQVTAVSGKSATVTRGYGGTSAEAHGSAAVYDIISNPRPQGMTGPKDESVARTRSYNYTQIFSKGVRLSGTALAIEHNGISAEDTYQIDKRMRELVRELDRTVIMGVRAAANVVDGTYGTMGGLIDYIKHASSGNTNSTAETLVPSVLNAMIKQIWDDGGSPDMVIVGGAQKQKISAFDKEYRRSTMDTRRAGFTVEEFVSDLGISLRVVVDRWIPSDVAIVIDSSRVMIKPLQGRSFFLEKLAKTGDSENWQIVGEYTMEVKQAAKAHAIHWNLKQ
jgi:hypothetical protein